LIRDQGPSFQLGFGVDSRTLNLKQGETEGPNPESGAIAKALHDHPLMRFLTVSAATMVGMVVAGSVVKKGGVKLGYALQNLNTPTVNNGIRQVRKAQEYLDDWQGITRTFADDASGYDTSTKLFVKDPDTNRILGDHTEQTKGWYFTRKEQETAFQEGREPLSSWGYKEELQQRLVRQARRLPYELPAAYITQRGITDTLFGEGEKENSPNWYNPVDVISDFVTQSVKNTAFMISPFEFGAAGASTARRGLMTAGDGLTGVAPKYPNMASKAVNLRAVMGQVGADSVDLLNKVSQMSSRATGAFATGIDEANKAAIDITTFAHRYRHGAGGLKEALKDKDIFNIGPGPFKGMGTGVSKARVRWGEIRESQNNWDKLITYGPSSLSPGARLETAAFGNHPIRDLAEEMQRLGRFGRSKGASHTSLDDKDWYHSDIYRGQMGEEYKHWLSRNLIGKGVDESDASELLGILDVRPPNLGGSNKHISGRMFYGKESLKGDTPEEVFDSLENRLSGLNPASRAKIRHTLPQAIDQVDTMFRDKKFLSNVDNRIAAQWDRAANELLPKFGEQVLGQGRVPYEQFRTRNLSIAQQRFLIRKNAQMTGMHMLDDRGRAVSDAAAIARLRKVGLDPQNFDQLTAMLTQKKAIAQPWSRGGANAFGIKPLGLSEALDRNYFHGSPKEERTIRRLSGQMVRNDPVSTLGSYKLKGVYQSSSGQVVDLTSFSRGFQKFQDTLANDFGIPIVSFNPLQLTGHSSRQELRERALLQYIPGSSKQSFLAGAEKTDDFYLWFKTQRGNKGKVWAFSGSQDGNIAHRELEGLYKPNSAIGGFGARFAKLAAGKKSVIPRVDEMEDSRKARLKKKFSFSDVKPDSVANYLSRFKNRKSDIDNPITMARLLSGETVKTRKGRLTISADRTTVVNESGESVYGPSALANSFEKFVERIGQSSLSPAARLAPEGVVKGASKKGAADIALFDFSPRGKSTAMPRTFDASQHDHIVDLRTLRTEDQWVEAARLMIDRDQALTGLPKAKAAAMHRGREQLLYGLLDESSGTNYWNRNIGGQSGTIQTRLDQLQANLYKYSAIRRSLLEPKSSFSQKVIDIEADLLSARKSGRLSQSQHTEARTALLSTQIHFANFSTYDDALSSQANTLSTIKAMMDDAATSPDVSRSILRGIGRGEFELSAGRLSAVQPIIKRNVGTSAYDPGGTEVNPFGTNTVLIPTFRSALSRDAKAAILSATGLKTWNNPEGFSGASMGISHVFERLNRPMTAASLGLDPYDFQGPLDFYARGIIGKRVAPLTIAGTTAVAIDRTAGGFVNERDSEGDRVYSPLVLGGLARGVAEGHSLVVGLTPGGQTYSEKRQELLEGEVPIRSGRWWPLGNTPWKGGRIEYFRPSWYRRFKSGHMYTEDTYGSPLERLAFGYDFSPLRPLDPYRFEREHYRDRPYPVSGEYFTGPWGPLTTALNATVGKVLKPEIRMHADETAIGLASYASVGQAGAFRPAIAPVQTTGGGPAQANVSSTLSTINATYAAEGAVSPATASTMTAGSISSINQGYADDQYNSPATAATITAAEISAINQSYMENAPSPAYGTPKDPGTISSMDPRVIPALSPVSNNSVGYQAGKMGYELQELFGIYGFGFGAARSALGFGDQDMSADEPVLRSASRAYGSSRAFWDLNLGGMGDFPAPMEGNFSNLEFSELVRRFIPRERSSVNYINPIANEMGKEHPWLPGSEYYINFGEGDPYTLVKEGEMRLPGKGYERFNNLHPDGYSDYGAVDQHKILGDVAPWSEQYRNLDLSIDSYASSPQEMSIINQTREQVQAKSVKNEFTPYNYKYWDKDQILDNPTQWAKGRLMERFAHGDTYFNTKFLPMRTAVEDWERDNVYGATFPQWQKPIQSFVKPSINKATQRDPIPAALMLGTVGAMFGRGPKGRLIGGVIGGAIGAIASISARLSESLTGRRYIPEDRRKEIALEEYVDILSYTKSMRGAAQARQQGDELTAAAYSRAAQTTMYGADVHNAELSDLAMAVPKRKREHFKAMMTAPEQERGRILSTAGRLERRLLQGAWGQDVEEKPDLEEYFENHELPSEEWEGWHPNTNMDHIKIKIGQSLGLDMSQMGYYPQQMHEANMINPSYPQFGMQDRTGSVESRLRNLLYQNGISGGITKAYTPYGGVSTNMQAGVR